MTHLKLFKVSRFKKFGFLPKASSSPIKGQLMGDKCKEEMKPESNANEYELKDQGNKYFALYKYVDALQCYNKAIMKNSSIATFYTNRSLCYIKMNQWISAAEDAKKSLELEPNLLKGHFFLGLALLELENYEDAIKHIHKAHELAKDQKLNYGDEITYALRLAKKKRFNQLEEKRIKQEVELQTYLVNLIENDKQRKFKQLEDEAIVNNLTGDELVSLQSETSKKCDNYINELNDMFSQLDVRRKKRDIPDYLCGKISFEIMKDPVITPSGITYSKNDIIEHLNRVGHFDPITRHSLTQDQLIPNLCMQEVVEAFLSENEWANEY